MDVSENRGTPQIGFSIINHPFWGTPIFRNPHIDRWGYPTISQYELDGRNLDERSSEKAMELDGSELHEAQGYRVPFFFKGAKR